ncbi:hypothetical protein [Roseovarius sp.]
MTDRPIIFSAPMVRALLEGRKTQTRRVLKPAKYSFQNNIRLPDGANAGEVALKFALGDRLWVRETVARQETDQGVGFQTYASDDSEVWPLTKWYHQRKTIPSIHMPRWASRLTLTVTDVRVQRLQEIDRGDAMEEGCPHPNMASGPDPRDWFCDLWNSLHGSDAWDANPWVVALTFTVHHCNIDHMDTGGNG